MNTRLPEGSWQIVSYRQDDGLVLVLEGSNPQLTVESDAVGGTAGINRFMANTVELPLGPVAMTMMAGPQELMDQEQRILGLLSEADSLVSGLSGMFLFRDGLAVVELVREGTEPVETHVR